MSPGNCNVTLASFYVLNAEAKMLTSTQAGSLIEAAKAQHKSLDTYPDAAPFHNHKLILLHYRATEKTKCHNTSKPLSRERTKTPVVYRRIAIMPTFHGPLARNHFCSQFNVSNLALHLINHKRPDHAGTIR